jgi:uncharacterized protein (TIGR03067 family)
MKRSLLLLLLVVPVTLGCSGSDAQKDPAAEEKEKKKNPVVEEKAKKKDLVAEEKQKLKGMWLVTGLSGGGVPSAANGISILEIADESILSYRAKEKGEEVVKVKESEGEYSYELDPSQEPKHIDITLLTGPGKGTTQKGIYALKGDELRLDVFFVNPNKERPTKFNDKWTIILERVKVPDSGKK